MTIVIQVRDGLRYTFWNVVEIIVQEDQTLVHHADGRPIGVVTGYVSSITRKDN
jgi:hypothetical protein